MRTAVLLLTLFGAAAVHAQTELPPPDPLDGALDPAADPSELDAPAQSDGQEEADERREESVGEEGDDDERDEDSDDGPGSLWGPLLVGGGACLGLDVVGGALSTLGCIFTQIAPDASGDNCVEDCVIGVISAGIVVLGLILATAGMVVLGPLAALVVTAATSISSALAGRAFWGAALGGLPGIALGIGGVVVAGYGLSAMDVGSSGGLQPGLFSGDPSANLALAGFGMAGAAGFMALAGALAGDLVLTPLSEEDEPTARAASSRPPLGDELPLALLSRPSSVAY